MDFIFAPRLTCIHQRHKLLEKSFYFLCRSFLSNGIDIVANSEVLDIYDSNTYAL